MIDNLENTDTTKPSDSKPKRFWLKLSIGISTLFLIIWLIPLLFSNFLFHSLIKRTFSEITHHQYNINFNKLKVNILTQKITFYDTQILKENGSIDNAHLLFQADTLMLHKIDLKKLWLDKIIKLNAVKFQDVRLELEEKHEKPNLLGFYLPLSNYISSIQINSVEVGHAEINYLKKLNSIQIPNLKFKLLGFRVDSLLDTVSSSRFHFSDIELDAQEQGIRLPNYFHKIHWENLKLSTITNNFELNNLSIEPLENNLDTILLTIKIPKFKLSDFDFESLIQNKQFLSKNLLLDIDSFNAVIKSSSKESKKISLKRDFEELLSKTFTKIAVDSGIINLRKSSLLFSEMNSKQSIGQSRLLVDHFVFEALIKPKYKNKAAVLSINDYSLENILNKQSISFEKARLSYADQSIDISGLNFVSDSSAEISLKNESLKLTKIDWEKALNSEYFIAEELILSKGNYTQLHLGKNKSPNDIIEIESLISSIFQRVSIQSIKFNDWNYLLSQKALNAEHVDMEFTGFELPSDKEKLFNHFTDFKTSIDRFSWVSKNQGQHFLAKKITANSENKSINILNLECFPRWKSLHNEVLEKNVLYKFYISDIKAKTLDSFDQFGSKNKFDLRKLSIDSVYLEQFGEAKSNAESDIFELFISNFELKKGLFTAYNDSSTLNRLAQVNAIYLMADSLKLSNDSLFKIAYKNLYAISDDGFYRNVQKGLNFEFKKLDFDSKTDLLEMHSFNARLQGDKKGQIFDYKLNSKLLKISAFNHNLFLQRKFISAKDFTLVEPKLISKKRSDLPNKIDFQQLLSAENIQQLPYLEFDRFIVQDLNWLASYTVKGNNTMTEIDNLNFMATDFRLSQWSFSSPDRVFFSKMITFNIEHFKQHINNGNYLLLINDIDFSTLNQQLNFNQIQFYTLQKENENNYNFTIDHISFNKINFNDFQKDFSLSIDKIWIQKPILKLGISNHKENSSLAKLNTLNLFPIFKPYFSKIDFQVVDITNMSLDLAMPQGKSTNSYSIGNLNMRISDFKIDSTIEAFQNNRFFYALNTDIQLLNYSARIANDMYELTFNNLNLSTKDGIIRVDSLLLYPLYNYEDFAKRAEFQTNRYDLFAKSIILKGIDFQDAIFRQRYTLRKAEINQLTGEVYRDGVFPRKSNYYPLNPIQRILNSPLAIQLDSLLLKSSSITYKEKGTHTEIPGSIHFDDINALILNASNNPDYIKYGGNTIVEANALLMGKSKLKLNLKFPLLKRGESFSLKAHLNSIEMDDLDPILRPLALIQARSGTIKSVDLDIEANDDYAYGEMLMLYSNMKIDVLNKSMKKGFFGSLLANALLKTENLNYLIPRKGPIYFERNKNRSIFNYWAEVSILGMKTSMGLADRRTNKQVKKLMKEKN